MAGSLGRDPIRLPWDGRHHAGTDRRSTGGVNSQSFRIKIIEFFSTGLDQFAPFNAAGNTAMCKRHNSTFTNTCTHLLTYTPAEGCVSLYVHFRLRSFFKNPLGESKWSQLFTVREPETILYKAITCRPDQNILSWEKNAKTKIFDFDLHTV